MLLSTMMRGFFLLIVSLMSLSRFAGAATGDDHITQLPLTVYEMSSTTAENMDFDDVNNMFVAHAGWYNDKDIHYYKFRMFTPETYENVITMESTSADVPIQKLYMMTTTGDFSGVVGSPVLEFHHDDTPSYSDFMEVVFVAVDATYVADTYKSAGDVTGSGAIMTDSGIILNIPLVPNGATLQDPVTKGTNAAPISPVPCWYKGLEVWTYVFEVTDQTAADYFSGTRTSGDADAGFAITVIQFASASAVSAIPLWHVNQFRHGVTEGNGGGPSPYGMRNVINLDRADPGYSPLWLINWVTELPVNYLANEASNPDTMTTANGFAHVGTPMFVNCPDIGPVGDQNPDMQDVFNPYIDLTEPANWLLGSDMDLIMSSNVLVTFKADTGETLGTTLTNPMGAYEFQLISADVNSATTKVMVEVDGAVIREITIDPDKKRPLTVYEMSDMTPENMDFDRDNNMFIAHNGWYNDLEIHYYKFRMFTPDTYPGVITMESTFADVPIQKLYMTTTTGDFSGIVGDPILEYHHDDPTSYSDFMEVVFVTVDGTYVADTYKSAEDVTGSGAAMTESGIILNIPLVPNGATLQDAVNEGTNAAPISPVPCWYKDFGVWTYVFEVTDQTAADHFAYTRTSNDAGYAITATQFASTSAVSAIPLWHVNQFQRGVTDSNGGGPDPNGMRNIINLDRGDAGYSPLWLINWVTELPIDYLANEASNENVMTPANGFAYVGTPMFVNCPDIGPVGAQNPDMQSVFDPYIDLTATSNWILGSDMTLIMTPDVQVTFKTDTGDTLGTTMTNMMGAYEYELMSADVSPAATTIMVEVGGAVIREITIDRLNELPPTVYELSTATPENMDFDKDNNMFVAHSGWYNDNEIHYYKFRMYTPDTYPGLITMDSTFADVPLQKVYLTTTSGDFAGAVGNPILEYHHADRLKYSDFMEIVFVTVSATYVADTYKSAGDIMSSGATMTDSGIVVNMPVVPIGATLQDAVNKGTTAAPISPVASWYKGLEVWTYVFEVTDQTAADHFSSTRTSSDAGYAITVTPFATATVVSAIPLWHVNQFQRGVTDGNGGGPDPNGMRNVINLDRGDAGYSPLWLINWVTELPINYEANDASNADTMTTANGFESVGTPMFVNCPDVGPVGAVNADKEETFLTVANIDEQSNWILGSDMTLIMRGGVDVTFKDDTGETIGSTKTNMMGAYEFELVSSAVNHDATKVMVMVEGQTIREVTVEHDHEHSHDDDSAAAGVHTSAVASLLASVVLVFFAVPVVF